MSEISYSAIKKKQTMIRYSIIFIIALVATGFYLTTEDRVTTTQEQPQKSNTLSISGPWEMSSLDPSRQGYILMRMQVIETLLNVDKLGLLTPGLATNWHVSHDGLTWSFTLREGVFFHDGTQLNAQATVISLKHANNKHSTLNKSEIESIEAVDEMQLRIQLTTPYRSFGALLSNYSTAIISPSSFTKNGGVLELYGSGAYKMESFSPPHKFMVKKFNNYWGEKAKITFASYLTGHRAESRLLQAKSGQVDIAFTLDPAMLKQLEGSKVLTLHSNQIPRTLFVKVNNSHPFLSDLRARQALSLALDLSAIATNVLHSPGAETTQLVPASMAQWYLQDQPSNKFDLVKAKALLTSLGWQAGDDGILYSDGQPFELTLLTYADRPELTIVATALQAQWAKIGVRVNINVTNSSMIPAGHADGSLEMALIARNFGFIGDPLPIFSTDFANGGGDWGAMNWFDSEVDGAIRQLLVSTDTQENYLLSQKVVQAIHDQQPVFPIANYSQHTAVNKRIKNFQFDPFERNYFINQMEIK